MSNLSISKIAELTGKARETVAKRVSELECSIEGKAKLYDTTKALPLIYGAEDNDNARLITQRARLTFHQANVEELREAELRGDLLNANEVKRVWAESIMSTRAKLLALPARLANKAIAATSVREIENFVRQEIHAALEELANETHPATSVRDFTEGEEVIFSTSGING